MSDQFSRAQRAYDNMEPKGQPDECHHDWITIRVQVAPDGTVFSTRQCQDCGLKKQEEE